MPIEYFVTDKGSFVFTYAYGKVQAADIADFGSFLTAGGCRRTQTLMSSSAAWPRLMPAPE